MGIVEEFEKAKKWFNKNIVTIKVVVIGFLILLGFVSFVITCLSSEVNLWWFVKLGITLFCWFGALLLYGKWFR
jgi:hypothetical protein